VNHAGRVSSASASRCARATGVQWTLGPAPRSPGATPTPQHPPAGSDRRSAHRSGRGEALERLGESSCCLRPSQPRAGRDARVKRANHAGSLRTHAISAGSCRAEGPKCTCASCRLTAAKPPRRTMPARWSIRTGSMCLCSSVQLYHNAGPQAGSALPPSPLRLKMRYALASRHTRTRNLSIAIDPRSETVQGFRVECRAPAGWDTAVQITGAGAVGFRRPAQAQPQALRGQHV
jgi:hypothetical protein